MAANKNLLAQQLNFHPGTSLIGNFGSTDTRFKPPTTGLTPGPGSYAPNLSEVQASAPQWTSLSLATRRTPTRA